MNQQLRTPSTTLLGEHLRGHAVKPASSADAYGRAGRVVPGHCDLAALGRAVVSEQVAQATARGITFRMSRSGPHAVAFADENLVREAVSALVAHVVERACAVSADAPASAGPVVEVAVDVCEGIATLSVRTSEGDGRFPKAPAMVPFAYLTSPALRGGDDVVGLVLADAVAAGHGGLLLVSADDDARCLTLQLPRGLRLAG